MIIRGVYCSLTYLHATLGLLRTLLTLTNRHLHPLNPTAAVSRPGFSGVLGSAAGRRPRAEEEAPWQRCWVMDQVELEQ